MSENEELLRRAAKLTPFDLPIGVYIVRTDGHFVNCNRRAREIFRLPLEGEIDTYSIARFYHDPTKRERMHRELLEAESNGHSLEQLLTFEVNGQEIYVQDFARSLRNEDDEVLGYVCCMNDVTEGERSNRLLDSLPAGVYKLDADDQCEQANRAFARILGYDSPDEIAGKPSSEFYVDYGEAIRLRKLVEDSHPKPVTNFIAELRKKDGRETIFANIHAQMVEGDDVSYAGREGTIIDVTREERYHRIMRDVPVGLNAVRLEGEKDIITHCNEQFLKIFDFSNMREAIGYDVRQLYASPAEYQRFRRELEAAARRRIPLVAHHLNVTTLNGEKKTIEISSQPLLDSDKKVVGRTSALRDITQEAELKNRLYELTYDFGSVLHNYTTTLLMVQLSSEPVIRSLGPTLFSLDKELSPDQANDAIAHPAEQLAEALAQLLELAKEPGRALALPGERWEDLENLMLTLRGYKEQIEIDMRPVVLCEVSLKVIEICGQLARAHKFAREGIRVLQEAARDLLRVTNLISLHQMRDAVIEMDHRVSSLREFVTKNTREFEAKEVCQVSELIRQVRSNLDNYARSRQVEFKIEREDARVRVVRREILRALGDLLHNAIKYSWSRDKTKSPWVTIRISVVEGQVQIEFENWGVPIRKEEIDLGLIFKVGYRGMHSGDKGRIGTGIGLADAQRVARAHGGDVMVTSHPAVGSRREDDYTQPFLTSVKMRLPLYRD